MKYALVLILLLGCTPSATEPSADDYTPAIAVAIGLSSSTAPMPPKPEPKPTPGICQNCDGTGRLGDTTVEWECEECNGTGRITAGHVPKKPGCEVHPKETPKKPQPQKGGEQSTKQSKAGDDTAHTQSPKPKLVLYTASGAWCRPCLQLKSAIKSNRSGLLDLLKQFDLKIFLAADVKSGPVPRLVCGDKTFTGSDIPALAKWLAKSLEK